VRRFRDWNIRFIILCSFVGGFLCYQGISLGRTAVSDTSDSGSGSENAATFYRHAMELLKPPKSQEIDSQMREVIKNGWINEHKGLEMVLLENQISIEAILRGTSLTECNFYFDETYEDPFEKMPPLLEINDLTSLLLLKARYEQKQQDMDKAADTYLTLLNLAAHIGQDDTLVSKMAALVIENRIYAVLKTLLISSSLSKEKIYDITQYLENYGKNHFKAVEIAQIESDVYINIINMLIGEIEELWITQTQEESPRLRTQWNAFSQELLKQGFELGDHYYGNFVKATQSGQQSDWGFAQEEMRELVENLEPGITSFGAVGIFLFRNIKGNDKAMNSWLAERVVKMTLGIAMPKLDKTLHTYRRTLEKLAITLETARSNLSHK